MGKNRNGLFTILSVIALFIVMWIYSGWNDYNADLYNYEIRYENPDLLSLNTLDIGFYSLFYLLHSWGISFANAHICIYGVALFIVCFIILRWSKMPVVLLLIYFAYHFVRNVVEMRNFLAFATLLLSMQYVGREGVYNRIKLAMGLLLSVSFHISYVPFLLLFFLDVKKNYNPYIWFAIFGGLSFFVNMFVAGWAGMLEIERLDEKMGNYLSLTHTANIVSFLIISFNMYIIMYYKKKSDKYVANKPIPAVGGWKEYMDYTKLMYNLNVMSGIFITFSAINFSFTGRLFGNVVFLNLIYISNYFMLARKKDFKDYAYAVLYLIHVFLIYPMAQVHYVDVFSNNSLLR